MPRSPAAVMDWPSGPSTIHSVGTRAVPDTPYRDSLLQIIEMMMNAVTNVSPNIA